MTTLTAFAIGSTSTTTTLATLGVPDPKSPFSFYADESQMASSKWVGRGLPIITWRWGYLTQTQRNALRAYCTGISATVYIDTQENDNSDAYKRYKCTMKWPNDEEREATKRVPFVLTFTHCEIQST